MCLSSLEPVAECHKTPVVGLGSQSHWSSLSTSSLDVTHKTGESMFSFPEGGGGGCSGEGEGSKDSIS